MSAPDRNPTQTLAAPNAILGLSRLPSLAGSIIVGSDHQYRANDFRIASHRWQSGVPATIRAIVVDELSSFHRDRSADQSDGSSQAGTNAVFLELVLCFSRSVPSVWYSPQPGLLLAISCRARRVRRGGLQPMAQAILAITVPPSFRKREARALRYTDKPPSVLLIGPRWEAGCPPYNYSWRWVFLCNVPVFGAVGAMIGISPREDPPYP